MRHTYFAKLNRLKRMQRSDAIATLSYLCKIGESDFATQVAKNNPQWGLEIVNQKVIYCASFGERVLSPQTWHPQAVVSHA